MNERTVPIGWLVALGAMWSLTLGAVVWFFMRRQQPLGLPSINIWNAAGGTGGGFPALPLGNPIVDPSAQPVMITPPAITVPTRLATYTLQIDRSSRIMTAASANYWRAQLRNVGPPGSIARVASEVNLLAYPSMSIAIPAGSAYEIRVEPGASLFAISDTVNTELSVAAAEDMT